MWGEEKTREYLEKAGFRTIETNQLAHVVKHPLLELANKRTCALGGRVASSAGSPIARKWRARTFDCSKRKIFDRIIFLGTRVFIYFSGLIDLARNQFIASLFMQWRQITVVGMKGFDHG
jgi:hypothetical protein